MKTLASLIPLLLAAPLSANAGASLPGLPAPRALTSPARAPSGEARLAVAPGGAVFMSWFEKRDSTRHALRIARLEGRKWSKPFTIDEGDSFFVNWADFPALAVLDERRLAAAWPWKSGADPYAYDVRVAWTRDGGKTWSAPAVPHRDATQTEHGFVSMVAEGDGARLVWLDGRKFAEKKAAGAADHHGEHGGADMTLRSAWVGLEGTMRDEVELDGRVCDCCQTGAARTAGGMVVAYRDRDPQEIRDVSVVRWDRQGWSEPAGLGREQWKIEGCPVNGPAVDARGEDVVVAWYTMAGDTARVRVAFSSDAGRSFGAPVQVDGGDPIGRVDLVLLEDGSALVAWLAPAQKGRASVLVRRIAPGGSLSPALEVASTGSARGSGFPRLARSGDRVLIAWTETGTSPRVKLAELSLPVTRASKASP